MYDLVYPFSKGGVEKRVREVAMRMAQRGHEVHVYGTKQWPGPNDIETDGLHIHGIPSSASIHGKRGTRSIWQGVTFALALGRRLARDQFEIVDVQNMSPLSCLVTLMVANRGATRVVTWHEVWAEDWRTYMGLTGYVGQLIERLIGTLGTHHVAVSQNTERKLVALGVKDAAVVRNGVDLEAIWNTPPSPLVSDVIHVGRLAEHKNVILLLEAMALLASRGVHAKAVVVGDGPDKDILSQLAEAWGLADLEFRGQLESDEEVYGLIKSAKVLVAPSLREGFGMVALEAFACGTPVVTVLHEKNADNGSRPRSRSWPGYRYESRIFRRGHCLCSRGCRISERV